MMRRLYFFVPSKVYSVKPISRLLLAAGSLLLIVTYFVPVWSIDLEAPQYPEGLGIRIFLHSIGSAQGNDLESINGLNHYIGMKRIEPDDIPELKMMPYIVGVFVVFGLLAAAIGKRTFVAIWTATFIAVGCVGMWDFYQWEYDYGHNLDPHAAIRIEDMNYQPPLIGSKQLLNFTAHSYPAAGGWIICASIFSGIAAFYLGKNAASRPKNTQQTTTVPAPNEVLV